MKAKNKKATKRYRICVVGAGHVGLVAAACFAELGHKVICVDNDEGKIKALKSKKMPFYEPGLDSLVEKNNKKGNLMFSSIIGEGMRKADVVFLAVGTPSQSDGSADLAAVENVSRIVAENLRSYKVIVEKSTVPVQTGKKVKEAISRYKKNSVDFDVASNPEFLREGKAIHDFFYPDRIVLGVESQRAETILRDIYSSVKAPLVVTDINTAELIKHASNSFLATKISFINAVSRLCDLAGADVRSVSLAMGLDSRIGKEFLQAGVGYGGSCFPKDVAAFIYISKKLGYNIGLLQEVERINSEQRAYFVGKIKEHLWVLKGKRIAILGLSFKPDTDDMRSAPSIDIVNTLLAEGARLSLYDPKAHREAKKVFGVSPQLVFAKDPYVAIKQAHCACFLTEWKEFQELSFAKIKKLMQYPFIADGRNMFERATLEKMGFDYIGIGA